jgi:hypothetical protein
MTWPLGGMGTRAAGKGVVGARGFFLKGLEPMSAINVIRGADGLTILPTACSMMPTASFVAS